MEDEEVIAISETFGVPNNIARDAIEACGKNVEAIKNYILSLPGDSDSSKCKCKHCGRMLKDPLSIQRGYGEECYRKYITGKYTNIFEGD
ncbi:MAG: DUF6011 domain-containing protein [Bacilli bacterium]